MAVKGSESCPFYQFIC